MTYLGVEIGGTKLQLALGTGDGQLVAGWRGSVVPQDGAVGILRQIELGMAELLAEQWQPIRAVGVGYGGPTHDASQTVIKSHHIAGWDGFPLAQWFTEKFQLPTVISNDADVAGLAEATIGAGQGRSPVFYITVGSGIGGGLIIDGQIYRGQGHGASEIGHLRVTADGDILETTASGWGIANQARLRLSRGEGAESSLRHLLAQPDWLTGKAVAEAADAGDEFARAVFGVAVRDLAKAIGEVIRLLCPQVVVIGGGVSLAGDHLFFEPLREIVGREAFQAFAGLTEIVPAALGEEVVLHGAIALAKSRYPLTKK